ncbi:MAG: hypothetical protein ABI399_00915 [Bauldia sp.]
MRLPLFMAGALALAAPALAENASPNAGRYAVQPSDDGFIRLDTETGSVSHCRRTAGVWHCEGVADAKSGIEIKVDALASAVVSLTGEVGRLKAELTTLKAPPPEQPRSQLSPEDEKELDRTLGFAERLMQRFFQMVHDMKGEDRPSI